MLPCLNVNAQSFISPSNRKPAIQKPHYTACIVMSSREPFRTLYRFAMPWLAESFYHEGRLYKFPSFDPPPPPPRIKVREERRRKAERSASFTSPESDREAPRTPLALLPAEHDNVSAGDEPHRSPDEDEIDEARRFEHAMVISNLVNHGTLRGAAKLRFQCLGKWSQFPTLEKAVTCSVVSCPVGACYVGILVFPCAIFCFA